MAEKERRFPRAARVALGVGLWLAILGIGITLIMSATNTTATDAKHGSTPSSPSADYLAAASDFRAAWSPHAIDALETTSIGITLETKYDEFSQTPRAYSALAEQCDTLDATRSAFDDLASVAPPTPPTAAQQSPDADVRANVADTEKSLAPLVESVDALMSDGGAQLQTLDTLCTSLTQLQPIADERTKGISASVTPHMVQPGASEQVLTATGIVEFACAGDTPCQPLASPAREAYAAAISAVNTRFDAAAAEFYTTHCPGSDLADYCALASALWTKRAAVDTESEARFSKETPLDSAVPLPEYTAWVEAADAELAASQSALDSWLASHTQADPPAPGANAFVSTISATADDAEHRFAELRDAASDAAEASEETTVPSS